MASSKKMRNTHAQRYIKAVFSELLEQEGFVAADEKLLCWYRIVNNELLHTVCFYSRWANMPLMVSIAYGILPLFYRPYHSTDIYTPRYPIGTGFYHEVIRESNNTQHFAPYAEDVQVFAPIDEGRGIHTLSDIILPRMNSIQTVEQAYSLHRETYSNPICDLSPQIIDEAIYLNDTSTFEEAKQAVSKWIEKYEKWSRERPTCKENKDVLQSLLLKKEALFDGQREAFLSFLNSQKVKTVEMLRKKYCIG